MSLVSMRQSTYRRPTARGDSLTPCEMSSALLAVRRASGEFREVANAREARHGAASVKEFTSRELSSKLMHENKSNVGRIFDRRICQFLYAQCSAEARQIKGWGLILLHSMHAIWCVGVSRIGRSIYDDAFDRPINFIRILRVTRRTA